MAFAKGCLARLAVAALSVLAAGVCAPEAQAAPRRAFSIPAQPLTRALLDFAIQADISIGADAARGCRPMSHGVAGQFTVAEALDQILNGTGCGYRMVDASTIRIVRLPSPTPATIARPRAAPPAAPAVVQAAPAGSALSEIVVTATRRDALILHLPDAIGSVSGGQITEMRDTGIGDLAGWAAGLTATNLGPGSDKIIIRGLSDGGLTGHTQSTVGIYLDDVRLTYNAPDPDLRLTDIDRLEVLQGPQGTLYGSGSIAGVVHIVTRQPDLGRYSGEISVTGSGTERGDPSGVVEGVANIPVVPGRLAVRAVAYQEHDGGYIDDVALGRSGTNSTDRTGFRLAAALTLNGDWSASFGVTHQTLASADSQYTVARYGAFGRGVLLQEPHSNDFDDVYFTLEGDLAPGRLKNTVSLVRHAVDTRYDASTALPLFADTPAAPAAYNEDDRIVSVVDEASLASAGSSRFQWLLGGFLSSGRQTLDSAIVTLPSSQAGQVVYQENRTDTIEELAVYGEASYDVTPKLVMGAGARANLTQVSTTSLVRAPLTGESAPFHGALSNVEWAPKLSARYQISERSMLYLLASEGSRGGGFNTGGPIGGPFSGPGGSSEPFRRFSGDELWNIEAGAKTRAFSDHLDLRATAFYAIWDNIQSDELLPSGLPYTANIGDGHNVGLELEMAYAIGGLELRLASLVDAPELTHNDTPFPSVLHSGLPGVPRGSVGATLHYERRVSDSLRPFFDANVDYVGQSRLTFDARTTRKMGDYTIMKLTAGADMRTWRLASFIDNPLAVTGDTFAYGNPFTLRRSHQITPLRPRTAGLELTRSF